MEPTTPLRLFALALAALMLAPAAARADDDDDDEDEGEHHGRGRQGERHRGGERGGDRGGASAALRATREWATYEKECGSCHLAFPPGMLPPKSWSALLRGLDKHFDQNAELDGPTRLALETWLVVNAGPDVPGKPLRITELPWWVREHREVAPAVYKRKAVTSAANCGACHANAKQGSFEEHEVRVPRDAPAPR